MKKAGRMSVSGGKDAARPKEGGHSRRANDRAVLVAYGLPPEAEEDDGMSPNPVEYCQNESLSAGCRARVAGRQGGNRARIVKKRARELSVWSIFPPRRAFSCGKNGISLLKEIFFLPQRRKFLAAKTFPGVWKAGKNGASGGFSLLVGGFPRAKSNCLFASLSPRGLTRGRHPSAWRPLAGGKVSRKTASGFHPAFPQARVVRAFSAVPVPAPVCAILAGAVLTF